MAEESADAPIYGPDGRVFYGAVTVGERGQVVIPARARREHGIEAGQKLLVLGSAEGIALIGVDRLFELLGQSSPLRDAVQKHREE
ncbi:AbrB/MazE/SpoVT family DNA-binding domain-containing protein [Microbacterium sp.]|uniref:AbrB/MazE/SpoVT family DNA-binding domain-containing protein n=1 Tax=Microbacterium sp. TaxID=51671 RepID=UPI00260E578C|nr:AbrB/MazE/SpoVT family DNA-binding domain-containing protein [Microbacterium sp.]